MGPLVRELLQNPGLAAYLAVGVIVGCIYMYQQRMFKSATQNGPGMGIAVLLMVAFLWPLILLSMILLWLQPRKPRPREPRE
jgi:hypothetical protein